jgi:hypothetical protein
MAKETLTLGDLDVLIKRINPTWGYKKIDNNKYEIIGPIKYTVRGDAVFRELLNLCTYCSIDPYPPPNWLDIDGSNFWTNCIKTWKCDGSLIIKSFGKSISIYDTQLGELAPTTKQFIIYVNCSSHFRMEAFSYFDEKKYNKEEFKRAARGWNHTMWYYVELKKDPPSYARAMLEAHNKELLNLIAKAYGVLRAPSLVGVTAIAPGKEFEYAIEYSDKFARELGKEKLKHAKLDVK